MAAVGLFANRNHQAVLLATLFPILAVFASAGVRSQDHLRIRSYIALAIGAILIPLLLITGSRAGLILGVLGLISVAFLFKKPKLLTPKKRKYQKFNPRFAFGALGVLCLGALTMIMSRAEAIQRLVQHAQVEDDRWLMWKPIAQMAWKYFPFGSGAGSFVEVYQIDEPYELLNVTYLNHAHNDYLEIYMTMGLPGLILLGVGFLFLFKTALEVMRPPLQQGRSYTFARLGLMIISIFALGSIGDYPLRTPSLTVVFVIAALWMSASRDRSTKKTGSS
jgi:O-antigen ligase